MIWSRPLPGDVAQTTGTLKQKYHFHQIFISVCTENCQSANSWYFSVSVWVYSFSLVTLYNSWYEFALGSQVAPLPRCLVACWPTHWGRVTHICVGNLTIIGSDNGSAPSHYLNQCWNIVNWNSRNKLQWYVNRNSYIFIQENPFENVVWKKMAAILCLPQCVKASPSMEHLAESHTSQQKHLVSCINESLVWNMHLLRNNPIVSEYGYLWGIASYMTDSARLWTCRESQVGVETLCCHPLAKTVTGGWGNIECAWMRHSIQLLHYNDVIMGKMASQITSHMSVYSAVYSDQRKHQSSASLAPVRGIH